MDKELRRAVLNEMGVDEPTWKTLVVYASEETDRPREELWEMWTRLENWPDYSPLFAGTRWIGEPGWKVGATFEQELILGFPVGAMRSKETVDELEAGRRVGWSKDQKGIKSKHVWLFEELSDGGTRITNLEVFHGTAIGLIKPLVKDRWKRLFKATVEGIINAVHERDEVFRVNH
ncbi:MAG: SRPBCC family protein [Chloroflexi bacterium]|nr:SRPBCC family protein [Chloroflexota bacterium]